MNYGSVRMQIQKTHQMGFAPRYTEDGVDYLYTELDLAVTAVVNPMALATNGEGNLATRAAGQFLEDAPAQANGDSLGVTLRNLRAMLLTPRQDLTFTINQDQVVNISGPDSKNGPLPQRDTYVRWIIGTRTALVYFHIKAWTVDLLPRINDQTTSRLVVLANRYRVTSTTDGNWYSRRHIAGQMIVDAGQLATLASDGVVTPDNFRQAAFLQIPTGFQRENIQVTVSSDNTTLDYSYIDQETPLALGPVSLATKIEGAATVGVESPLAKLSGLTALIAAGAQGGSNLLHGGGGFGLLHRAIEGAARLMPSIAGPAAIGSQALAHPAELIAATAVGAPKITATGLVRITGQRNAEKEQLARLGVNILIDRFSGDFFDAYFTPGGAPRVGSIIVTQDLVERQVEVNMTFLPRVVAQAQALVADGIAGFTVDLMDMTAPILSGPSLPGQIPQASGAASLLSGQITGVNPLPPSSGGTRGDWLGALVVALLGLPGIPPVNAIADPAINLDVANFI